MAPVFADERVLKDAHNAKYDTKVLRRAEMPVSGLGYDTMLAAYLAGETSIGLKDLGFTKLGVQMTPITDLIGKGRSQVTMDVVPMERAAQYAAADVAVTERLRHYYAPLLQREQLETSSDRCGNAPSDCARRHGADRRRHRCAVAAKSFE